MKRLLILFVVVDLLLLVGVIAFLAGDEEAPQPTVPAPVGVAEERPLIAPERLPEQERPVVLSAKLEPEAPTEAELEEQLSRAEKESDWRRVAELRDKLAELQRKRAEEMLREMRMRDEWTLEPAQEGEPSGTSALRRMRLRAVAPEVDDNGAAPMAFGRGMFGPWDTGRKVETP